jgi:hypothetical protein
VEPGTTVTDDVKKMIIDQNVSQYVLIARVDKHCTVSSVCLSVKSDDSEPIKETFLAAVAKTIKIFIVQLFDSGEEFSESFEG